MLSKFFKNTTLPVHKQFPAMKDNICHYKCPGSIVDKIDFEKFKLE